MISLINNKKRFHQSYEQLFKYIAYAMGYKENEYEIRHVKKGYMRLLGWVVLHTKNLYISIGGPFSTIDNLQTIKYRKCNGINDFIGTGKNYFMDIQALKNPEKVIDAFNKVINN